MKLIVAALGLVSLLTGCSTIGFYSPEVDASWTSAAVKSDWIQGSTLLGVTLKSTGEGYSVGKRVGGLLDGGFVADRTETWDVAGPDGYRGQITLVQKGIRYSGVATNGSLTVQSSDWSQVTYRLTLTDENGPVSTDQAPWKRGRNFTETWGRVALVPSYLGQSDDKVTDYQSAGLVTGYRLVDGDQLLGYLDLGRATLRRPVGAAPLPVRTVAWVLWGFHGHDFTANPATLPVQGLSIDLNGTGQIKFAD